MMLKFLLKRINDSNNSNDLNILINYYSLLHFEIIIINPNEASVMNPKKFAATRSKNLRQSIEAYGKENKKPQVQLPSKKSCINMRGFSEEITFSNHKKSIANEQISVFLQHSQNKTFGFDRNWLDRDIRTLTNFIKQSDDHLNDTLKTLLESGDIKSDEVITLIDEIIQKINHIPEGRSSSVPSSCSILQDNIMRPYLQQEITLLQCNFQKVKKKHEQLLEVKKFSSVQSQYIMKALQKIQDEQLKQLALLSN